LTETRIVFLLVWALPWSTRPPLASITSTELKAGSRSSLSRSRPRARNFFRPPPAPALPGLVDVGFIVTNMSRRAERAVAFYNKRGTAEQWIKEGKGAIKWTRLHAGRLPPTWCVCSFMRSPATSAIFCTRCDAGADQGLVAVKPEGEAD
jgi:hypothetical protein